MSDKKVSTVDGRDVKFFPTRKKARRFKGTKGVHDIWEYYVYDIKKEDRFYRWFVFLDTKPENVEKQGECAIIPNVAGQPVHFFATRQQARMWHWVNKGFPAKYLDLHKLHVPYEGNVNNYRWFVYI